MEFSAREGHAEAEEGLLAVEGVPITLAMRNTAWCKVLGRQDPRFHRPEAGRANSDNNVCLSVYYSLPHAYWLDFEGEQVSVANWNPLRTLFFYCFFADS